MARSWPNDGSNTVATVCGTAAWLRQHTSDSPSLLAAAIEIPRGPSLKRCWSTASPCSPSTPSNWTGSRPLLAGRAKMIAATPSFWPMHCAPTSLLSSGEARRAGHDPAARVVAADDELAQEQNRAVNRCANSSIASSELLQLCESLMNLAGALFELVLYQPVRPNCRKQNRPPAPAASHPPAHCRRSARGAETNRSPWRPARRSCRRTRPAAVAAAAASSSATRRLGRRINAMLDELATPAQDKNEHRDAAILLSLPDWEEKSPPRCSARPHSIADRDYHALRCTAEPRPSPARAQKENRAHAPRINAIANALYTGRGSASSSILKARALRAMRPADTRMEEPCAAWPTLVKLSPPCSPPTPYDAQRRAA